MLTSSPMLRRPLAAPQEDVEEEVDDEVSSDDDDVPDLDEAGACRRVGAAAEDT